ncbi:MAG: AAA family ATPase [Polyangiaceae bacterium]
MIVSRLKLSNVRAVEAAEFSFKAGFNLVVGVNGAGKTTALEALATCLAGASSEINHLKKQGPAFRRQDVRNNSSALSVECTFTYYDHHYEYTILTTREAATGQRGLSDFASFQGQRPPDARKAGLLRPVPLFFSTRRAVPITRSEPSRRAGANPAFADSLSHRELRLNEFSAWLRTRRELASENKDAATALKSLDLAVGRFLPGYDQLRLRDGALVLNRGSSFIAVNQLSDGERSSIALVLEITRRLAQANPTLQDPAANGLGVVLIDEIDLHLHPKWQREIVRSLPSTFPKLQFIATTHSPQVIGEVEHDRIQVMRSGRVFSPTHSFGVDSNRVLEEIMDAASRSPLVQALVDKVTKSLAEKNFTESRKALAALEKKVGEADAAVVRARTLIDFLEGDQ